MTNVMQINSNYGRVGLQEKVISSITALLWFILKVASLNQPPLLIPKMTFLENIFIIYIFY